MKTVFYDYTSENVYYDHSVYPQIKKHTFDMHTHNLYELIYFIKGDATHIIEDRKYKLSKHDLIIIHPSKYHYIEINSEQDYERYNILFNAEKLGINNIPSTHEIINLAANPIVNELFTKFDFYRSKLSEEDFSDVATLLIKELFYNLSVFDYTTEKRYSTLSPVISNALRYINENLFTLKNIEEIANKLYVTESYLFKLFKTELKTTPKKYITDKRLLAAQNMLLMGKTPTKVYSICGYNDYTAFYRSYVKFFGHAPSKEQ